MGTRSKVGVMHGDTVKSVYCHYDGYLSGTGQFLQTYYNSAKANQLVALGDNRGIEENVDKMYFYGRDRNETDVSYEVAHSFDEFLEQVDNCGAEYYYIMKDDVWYAGAVYETKGIVKNSLVRLDEALNTITEKEYA